MGYDEIFNYIIYDETSPTLLRWKDGAVVIRGRLKDSQAGNLSQGTVTIKSVKFLIKNAVWYYHHGKLPKEGVIKHLDGDTTNNRIENLYIYKHRPILNKQDPALKDYFSYDESSPSKLVWSRKYGEKGSTTKVGSVAGTIDDYDGYWRVNLAGNKMRCHRIVWYLFNGVIPDNLFIDHINGDKLDNSISNLRLVMPKINSRNRAGNKNNTSGAPGITYFEGYTKKGTPFSKYYVTLTCDGKKYNRSFSCEKYGKEQAFKLACAYRQQMIDSLNNEGAGYTDRHGKGI